MKDNKELKTKIIGFRLTNIKYKQFNLLCKLLNTNKSKFLENLIDEQLKIYKY